MDQAFLEEAIENAEAFSAGMVDLERAPEAEAAALVNELFRRAHNLKGMAAMEDQPALATLAHGAEDLLSRYRDEGGRPRAEEVDALLAAADAMEAMVQALAAGGQPASADELLARLRAFTATDATPVATTARPTVKWADDVTHGLEVTLVEGTPAPRARARILLRTANEMGDVAGTDPPELDGVDAANLSFVIGFRSVPEEDALTTRLRSFREVAAVETVALEHAPAPAPAAAPEPAAAPAATTVRVDVERLDQLLDLVGELVVEKNRLLARAADVDDRRLHESAAAVADVVGDLRDVVSRVRMVSLEATFTRMQRVARDVARELEKPIELALVGESTELDRSVVDEVLQPLVHLVRNAIDHGIEPESERVDAGKPAAGTVRLVAEQRGAEVIIEVADDGGGIDVERLGAKAVEKGLVAREVVSSLEPEQVYDLMFLPGFSSRDEASLVSGRGVGLDVVRGKVEALGGSVAVRSVHGEGTTFALHFPLSLVVLDSLLVQIASETWALPVTRCEETIRLDPLVDVETKVHRNEELMIIDGAAALGRTSGDARPVYGVVIRESGGRYVLTVDRFVGRAEVVVKPAPRGIPGTEHISGVTVLSEGEVALVPDLALVVRRSRAAGVA